MVVGREVGFESGAADLIYVDEGGQVVLVKLKKGTERPTPDRPERFRQLVAECTAPLRDCEGATPTSDGDERQIAFHLLEVLKQLLGAAVEEREENVRSP